MDKIYLKTGGTILAQTVVIDKIRSNFLIKFLLFVFWLAGILSFFVIIFSLIQAPFDIESYLGFSYLVFGIFLFYLALRSFFFSRLLKKSLVTPAEAKQRIAAKQQINLFDTFSYDLGCSLVSLLAGKKLEEITLKEIASYLIKAKDMSFILLRLGLGPADIENVLEETKNIAPTLILEAIDIAQTKNHISLWSSDLFLALCKRSAGIQKLLRDLQLELEDVEGLLAWQTTVLERIEENGGFFNPKHLKKTGGIGKDWAFGYTVFLKQYSVNITEHIESHGLGIEIIGRSREIKQIEEALLRSTDANVIIVGDAGVGKHTTVLGFAKKVYEGEIDPRLAHCNIYQIDTEALISGSAGEGDLIKRFQRVLEEASYAGNVIIVIENIDNLFSNGSIGTADLTEILLPYLNHSSVHIIGTSEVGPYNEHILANNSLAQRFVRISVEEPAAADLVKILQESAPMIEYHTGSIITYEAIKTAIKNANRYMVNLTDPEKSIGLLEGAATKATTERGKTIVLTKDVENYISEKYEIPSAEAGKDEKEKLLQLEKIMHETVIGQDEAIKAVANAMRRARAQISDSKKPIGSFLFLGPTGVGKTATAKALARAYFGSPENMIRFDMSEYQNSADIYRLIGTKDEGGNLTTFVTEKPFSLLLFDEIEKCNPEILNLFLQILDEGVLTDGRGKKILFTNTIIIATSNAGSDLIHTAISEGNDYEKLKGLLENFLIEQNIFRPELLNRFTAVVAFSPLSLEAIKEVAKLVIANMEKSVSNNKGITVQVASDAIDILAEMGFDPKMGARPMERTIQEKVENLLAEKILKGELQKGSSITITKEMIS